MDQKSLLFTPEGVRDIYGEDCERRAKIQQGIHTIMKQYGFKNIQTPTFEFFDIFNRERGTVKSCLLYTSPSPRDVEEYRMPSSA